MSQAVTSNEKVSVVRVVNHNNNNNDEDDSDDYFADVGFMFESQQPVRLEKFQWNIPERGNNIKEDIILRNDCGNDHSDDRIPTRTTKQATVQIALHVADDHPGAVQSGHYLWPAATMLSEYLIHHYNFSNDSNDNHPVNDRPEINTVIELGAGCAMVSFVALQLWKETLQCICITDHDPSTLVRAQDNYETTMQLLFNNDTCLGNVKQNDDETALHGTGSADDDDDDDNCDEQLNDIINTITNIPVLFESLKWGDRNAVEKLLYQTLPERLPLNILFPSEKHRVTDNHNNQTLTTEKNHHHFDIVLGSDLIYCMEVVRPLFTTAVQLMRSIENEDSHSYFILAQSFVYDTSTENEIDDMCVEFQLHRKIVIDFDNENTVATSKGRIQEFCFKHRIIV
jgi:Lysine methyltransferase